MWTWTAPSYGCSFLMTSNPQRAVQPPALWGPSLLMEYTIYPDPCP